MTPDRTSVEEAIEVLENLLDDLETQNASLKIENEELREGPIEFLSPYAMPTEIFSVLLDQLAGWPTGRWRELARLIERQGDRVA